MKLLDRLFGGRPKEAEAAAPVIMLDPLVALFGSVLEALAGHTADPDVVRAKLADIFRDLGAPPIDPEVFATLAAPLDKDGWARLELATMCVRLAFGMHLTFLSDAVAALIAARGAEAAAREGFIGFALSSPLLTVELLRESPLRREELVRRWIASLGAHVAGETPGESRAALERLDYARLLAELERAKLSAEERMAYLQKLQEAHDATRVRRGKW